MINIDIVTSQFTKTKIIATVGPGTQSREAILHLIDRGVNAIRLNFSYGTHENHQQVIDAVKQINITKNQMYAYCKTYKGLK